MTKALFSSIFIHISLLFALVVVLAENTPKLSIKQTKKISLKHIVLKKVEPTPEISKKPISKEEKKIKKTEPKPQVKPKPIKPKPKPKPKLKSKPQIKPKIKKHRPKHKKTKKHIIKHKIRKTKNQKVVKQTKHISKNIETMPVQTPRQDYILLNKNKIYEAIQRAKRYPRFAKKLNIQGIVHVRFTLHPNGQVTNIQTSNAHKILKKSARQTIIEASPEFPKTKQKVDISLNIAYKLR